MKKLTVIVIVAFVSLTMIGCKGDNITAPEKETPSPSESINIPTITVEDKNNEGDKLPLQVEDNIKNDYLEDELFHVNFKAITQPVGKELESYYSDMETDATYTHSSRIPKELAELILGAMSKEEEETTFTPLRVGTEISQEEFCNLTGLSLEETEAAFALKVDVDNDGIEDLVGQIFWGGTGGFSSMQLYKGSKDGSYELTSSMECLLQDYSFLSYQGKNYLLMKQFNYYTKYYSGYTLYLYESGILADGMSFTFEIIDYEMKIISESTNFVGIEQIKKTLCNKNMPKILENNDGVIYGTAESIDESYETGYRYSSDIDNDGKTEKYDKYMWYPSNMGTVMQGNYEFEDSTVLDNLCNRLAEIMEEYRFYTFWVDKVEGKNVIYLYYGKNLDYSLYAFLIEQYRYLFQYHPF